MSASLQKTDFIWSIAELLRHDYKRSDYGKVILPLTVLRRLDCVLAPTKTQVLKAVPDALKKGEKAADYLLNGKARQAFHNRSPYDFRRLLDEPNQLAANLAHFINGFSANIREIIEYFSFADQIVRLEKADLLYKVIERFSQVDLHPSQVDNHDMGLIYEELIRRFSELSNETAGEHFTPREVIRLMVNLLFLEDRDILRKEGIVKTLYDPACGTGGMLSTAEEYLRELNPQGRLELFGQEINPESYAICKADMVIKGNNAGNIKFGNSFTTDGLQGEHFDYMLSNPPFGVEWKKVERQVRDEHEKQGFAGRFGVGLPRISDGSLLFLQHMLAKRKDGASNETRLAIVFNGSPLFSGGAESGESRIRRWIIENDWLEAIIALPDQLFYNTGISTYVWILTTNKSPDRRGKLQLVNASSENFYHKMPKSLGNKRHKIGDGTRGTPDHIAAITRVYGDFAKESRFSKVFDNAEFGYRRITVERPLRMNFQRTPGRLAKVLSLKLPHELLMRASDVLSKDFGDETYDAPVFFEHARFIEEIERVWREADELLPEDLPKEKRVKFPSTKQMRLITLAMGECDERGAIVLDEEGEWVADPELRDFENVPLKESVDDYFAREVTPHVPDAWINRKVCDEKDGEVGKVGYEIPFARHFYEYKQPPRLADIEREIVDLEKQIQGMLEGVLQ
jgi:type I restriction enzyme M protein